MSALTDEQVLYASLDLAERRAVYLDTEEAAREVAALWGDRVAVERCPAGWKVAEVKAT